MGWEGNEEKAKKEKPQEIRSLEHETFLFSGFCTDSFLLLLFILCWLVHQRKTSSSGEPVGGCVEQQLPVSCHQRRATLSNSHRHPLSGFVESSPWRFSCGMGVVGGQGSRRKRRAPSVDWTELILAAEEDEDDEVEEDKITTRHSSLSLSAYVVEKIRATAME